MKITRKTIATMAIVAFSAAFPGAANAQCGSSPSRQALFLPMSPSIEAPALEASTKDEQASRQSDAPDKPEASIVGLWDVKFMSGGQLYDEGFDQYHSDGTEIMVDIPPPATGNVCLGVWAKTGPLSYKLKHPFWIFDTNGTLIGRGLLRQQFTLNDRGDTYTGKFSFEFSDLSGKSISSMPTVTGQLTARRIAVD